MERTEKGLDIIARSESTVKGCTVLLTRKTNLAGEIRHGVVLESRNGGRHQKVGTFEGIAPAWAAYRGLKV